MRVAEKIPTIREFIGVAEVVSRVTDHPRLAGRESRDSIDFPAFQQLSKALLPRDGVTGLQSETVPGIVVAVGVLRLGISAVLWESSEAAQGTLKFENSLIKPKYGYWLA